MFDFDGTLTATPGDRAARRNKIDELIERTPFLRPWLEKLRQAGITIGVISKSSEATIQDSLKASGLNELFDGPILPKAVGFDGKAGFIQELCVDGALSYLGDHGQSSVLLVDDDINELLRARQHSIQTWPAPGEGGLGDDDFHELFEALSIEKPTMSTEVLRLWTLGLTAKSIGLNSTESQEVYASGSAPDFSDIYDVDQVDLGQGSFGVCKSGIHRKTGTRCAVKIVEKRIAGGNYLHNFVHEDMFNFLLKMSLDEPHPNVVKQLDYLMGHQLIYDAMELLTGCDLFVHLQENAPITEGFAQRTMHQVLIALRHIHRVSGTGLIHRDVKLENLRFRSEHPNSDLVLVDLGLSCTALPQVRRGIVGTLLYMAPEIFSRNYGTQVDLWSAGVVLYIVLTGKPPWMTDSFGGFPNCRVLHSEAVASALAREEIQATPSGALELLRSLLVVDPSERLTADHAVRHEWCCAQLSNVQLDTSTQIDEPPSLEKQISLIKVKKEEYEIARRYSRIAAKASLPSDWSSCGMEYAQSNHTSFDSAQHIMSARSAASTANDIQSVACEPSPR